jgi:hypothetical protein
MNNKCKNCGIEEVKFFITEQKEYYCIDCLLKYISGGKEDERE